MCFWRVLGRQEGVKAVQFILGRWVEAVGMCLRVGDNVAALSPSSSAETLHASISPQQLELFPTENYFSVCHSHTCTQTWISGEISPGPWLTDISLSPTYIPHGSPTTFFSTHQRNQTKRRGLFGCLITQWLLINQTIQGYLPVGSDMTYQALAERK